MPDDPHHHVSVTSRSATATIPPSIVRYLKLVLMRRGLDLQPALSAVGLEPDILDSPDLRSSYRQGSAVIKQALRMTGDSGLGLDVGSAQQATSWGLVGLALLASETLQDAVALGVRFQNMTGAMLEWSLHDRGRRFALHLDLPDPGVDPEVGVFLVDEGLASVVAVTRQSLGDHFAPDEVALSFPRPPHAERYSELFACPVRFGAATTSLVFPAAWSRRPMPGHDPWTLAATLQLVEAAAQSRVGQQDLLEGIEISITQGLPDVPSLEDVARRHNMSTRTLRRRLAACGTTYEAIVDTVRRLRVEQLLSRPPITFRDVARQVGFSDERTLRRAVARWYDLTPSRLRDELRTGQLLTGPAEARST